MATSDADGKRSLFRRGLNVTRFALAFAVTVIIVTTVIYAVVVVSRKEQLTLSVADGIIHVTPQSDDPTLLGLIFTVKANNPSGRVRFYYTNIMARVVLPKNGTNSTVPTFTFARFWLGADPNMDVSPWSLLQRDAAAFVDSTENPAPEFSTYFNQLRNDSSSSSSISDAMLRLNGTLTVGLYSVHNKTSEQTLYYCYPLTIAPASNASADATDDVQCQTDDPWK